MGARNPHEINTEFRSPDFVKLRVLSWIVPSSSFFTNLQERETAADYPFFSSLLELKLESLDDVEVQEVLDYLAVIEKLRRSMISPSAW